jgi:uncharacterized protein (UPF0264 family)
MPRGLLVSVRDVDEAVEALAGGAAIVDVKLPVFERLVGRIVLGPIRIVVRLHTR